MSELQKIQSWIDSLGEESDTFPFLLNGKGSSFNTETSRVFYGGPYWGSEEISSAVHTLIFGKWIAAGENVHKFEEGFSRAVQKKTSVMTNSGSSANLLMITALKEYLSWDNETEIIVSPVGFPTTIAPLLQNQLTPKFVDIELTTLNFDITKLSHSIGPKTGGILISPALGNPPDMEKLSRLAKKHNIPLILDGCDSLGSKWRDKHLAEFCIAASCSFYPAHHISTGEGGMVSVDCPRLAKKLRSLSQWGRDCFCHGFKNALPNGTCGKRFDRWIPGLDHVVDHKYVYSSVGYNLKPLDLQGSIGVVQLKKLEEIVSKRRLIKERLHKSIEEFYPGLTAVNELPGGFASWFGLPIIADTFKRQQSAIEYFEKNRIQTRNFFGGNILHQPAYRYLGDFRDYPNANEVIKRVFFLGCSPTWSSEAILYIESVIEASSEPLTKAA